MTNPSANDNFFTMSHYIQQLVQSILEGLEIDRRTAVRLACEPDQQALWKGADRIRQHFHGSRFALCSIINARSGRCSEDCRFCAQSARHRSGIEEYEVIAPEQALEIAADSGRYGVHRLSLVTSGRSPHHNLLDRLAVLYAEIARSCQLQLCGSMGLLTGETASRLRDMGVVRYHCNLEVSRNFFPHVCTTHTWEDKAETLRLARDAGMSLCSGGIIGMGESMEDRIDMALELRQLQVDSIPLNILTPIAGTPLADLPVLAIEEILTVIALFRFLNPSVSIRIAGGRQQLGKDQYRCFTAGANGAMVGNYLTTSGMNMEDDLRIFRSLGFTFD
ncbi:MAG: biotin synthase BioB [Desulfobulbaceae bacterium]|nr:biotin synthase BioB [Desulfobulbaceae bacterium]